jgi:hypothetical protein
MRDLYRKALSIAQEQEAKLWELRAAASLAQLRRDQGRRAEARDLLAPVYGWMPATTAQTAIAAITALSFRKSISTSAATTVRNAIIGPSNTVPITAKLVVQSRTLLIEQSHAGTDQY